jgi:hypothetical protein
MFRALVRALNFICAWNVFPFVTFQSPHFEFLDRGIK